MASPEADSVDVILIGAGLASAAAAMGLACTGARVCVIPGVARPRSVEADGGVVDPALLADAFIAPGTAAPLGPQIDRMRDLEGALTPMAPPRRAFDRASLEMWALHEARLGGVTVVDGFVEEVVIPLADGRLCVRGEDAREINARAVVLCEGSDPRIAMRAGLRPDYPPEEQIHLAKVFIRAGEDEAIASEVVTGPWRTSWGMPVLVTIVPQRAGVLVIAAARIENVMRCNRSTMDALDEALGQGIIASMLQQGQRAGSGVELVSARGELSTMRLASDGLLVGAEAAGALDPRDVRRWDRALRSGMLLADHLGPRLAGGHGSLALESWETVAMEWIRATAPEASAYHEDRTTGFIEDGPRGPRVVEPVQRLGKGLLAWLRPR